MSIEEVAQFMLSLLQRHGELLQEYAGIEIENRFGNQFARLNEIGQMVIDTEVLAAFRKLSGDNVVWSSGLRLWRFRDQLDEPDYQSL